MVDDEVHVDVGAYVAAGHAALEDVARERPPWLGHALVEPGEQLGVAGAVMLPPMSAIAAAARSAVSR